MQKNGTSLLRAMKLSLNFKKHNGKQGNVNNDLKIISVWREEDSTIKVKYKARDGKVYTDKIEKLDDVDVQMLVKMIDCLEAGARA